LADALDMAWQITEENDGTKKAVHHIENRPMQRDEADQDSSKKAREKTTGNLTGFRTQIEVDQCQSINSTEIRWKRMR
jgi:hypothetical protein